MDSAGAVAILVCVYGNRAYDNAFVHLEDIAKKTGFRMIGARGLRFGNAADDLSAAGEAIFIALAMGGDMTPTGDLGIPVQLVFFLKDGKFIGRLPELMLSGNISALLGKKFRGAINLPDSTRLAIADFDVSAS